MQGIFHAGKLDRWQDGLFDCRHAGVQAARHNAMMFCWQDSNLDFMPESWQAR
jgi:hypothetical protein